jgi:chromosomal replication initiation ATPase DnaA
VADVLEAVAAVSGTDPLLESQQPHVIRARRLACHVLRDASDLSYPAIADALGYSHHMAVMHQVRQPVDPEELAAVRRFLGLGAERPPVKGGRS